MERGDEEDTTRKLTKKANRLKIDDHDVTQWEEVKSAFSEHLYSHSADSLPKTGQVIYSDITCNQEKVLFGISNGNLRLIDPNLLSESLSEAKGPFPRHAGLSCVRCSKITPDLFYTSSISDGKILLWDLRLNPKAPARSFVVGVDNKIGGTTDGVKSKGKSSNKSTTKPILQFDVSHNDQVICAGTELVGEDSYLLFWDIRSSKLLGAYWESHSDDVTAVRFHPCQSQSLASGSTDGLINVFNLMESSEDDALIYSLNTESSVGGINWSSIDASLSTSNVKPLPTSAITCVTHTNEVQIWDADTGDQFDTFNRNRVSDAMMRSNPDAVYVNECYQKIPGGALGLLTCSLAGTCSRFIDLSADGLQPKSLFIDQFAVIQTAQFFSKGNKWITCDEDGIIKSWAPELNTEKARVIKGDGKKVKDRHKPYSREKFSKIKQ